MPSILSSIFNRTWTIKDLMNIDQGRQSKALLCLVNLENIYYELKQDTLLEKFKKLFSKGNKDKILMSYVIFKFSVVSDSGNINTVIIRTQPDFNSQMYLNNRVQIYCTCKDFMYRSAWILKQHNSLFDSIKTRNKLGDSIVNAPASKTKTSTLCKHSYAALNYLVNNYNYIMNL